MGFFKRLFGRVPAPPPPSPDTLRERLFDAVQSGNGSALTRLCAEHEAAILEHFPSWRTVPEPVRGNPATVQRYGEGLIGLARHFLESRSNPELLQQLMGPPTENPLVRWKETMRRTEALMKTLEFDGALALLAPANEELGGLSSKSAISMRGITLGKMAACHFLGGRAEAALPLVRQAIELCREAHDESGITTNLSNLFEVLRYLGQATEAADVAAECAMALERSGKGQQARRFRTLSELVRRGEPLNRVVVKSGDSLWELEELPPRLDGTFQLIFCRNRMSLPPAKALVERGRELGAKGRYDEALALFREASRIDPHAPEPLHEEAVTLLHLQRAEEAAACYEKLEALAPGWFHCRAWHWLAAGIAAGRIPYSAFLLLRALEAPDLSEDERVLLARRAIGEAPGVPAFHLQLGQDLARLGRSDEARQVLEEGLRLAEEPDIRSRLLVEASRHETLPAERDRKLREALSPGGNLIAAALARISLGMGTDSGLLH